MWPGAFFMYLRNLASSGNGAIPLMVMPCFEHIHTVMDGTFSYQSGSHILLTCLPGTMAKTSARLNIA